MIAMLSDVSRLGDRSRRMVARDTAGAAWCVPPGRSPHWFNQHFLPSSNTTASRVSVPSHNVPLLEDAEDESDTQDCERLRRARRLALEDLPLVAPPLCGRGSRSHSARTCLLAIFAMVASTGLPIPTRQGFVRGRRLGAGLCLCGGRLVQRCVVALLLLCLRVSMGVDTTRRHALRVYLVREKVSSAWPFALGLHALWLGILDPQLASFALGTVAFALPVAALLPPALALRRRLGL